MNKSDRLQPVLRLEEMKEQEAVKRFAQARTQVAEEQQKLEQLLAYSREYQEMVQARGREGIGAVQLQSYHQFIAKLATAIAHQQQQLSLVQSEVAQEEERWLAQRAATGNMEKLVTRYAHDESAERARKEQKELDEQAQKIAALSLY